MEKISHLSQLDLTKVYSYADYLEWKFEERVELIRGLIFIVETPNTKHQRISIRLCLILYNWLEHKRQNYEAFAAPFDVRLFDGRKSLSANTDIHTVVQPDLCVICDASKIDEIGCLGSPDLVVEILLSGDSKKEMSFKKQLYEDNGIPEYWIFDPDREVVIRFNLDKASNHYGRPLIFMDNEILESEVFPDLKINLKEIFKK
ncbi:MAG: hypothetical protein RL329_2580 [Bacteroidota bacterium]|jgi:Uma2 family endonuclease